MPRLFSGQLRDLCAGPYEDQVIFKENSFPGFAHHLGGSWYLQSPAFLKCLPILCFMNLRLPMSFFQAECFLIPLMPGSQLQSEAFPMASALF